MSPAINGDSPTTLEKLIDVPRSAGCCAGQAVGCVVSFLTAWAFAFILSMLLTPLFGQSQAGSVLTSGLTCIFSLVMGTVLSFLVGRLFPIFKKKTG